MSNRSDGLRYVIRMQDPLKQGLKLRCFDCMAYTQNRIRMQDPLKQGLKPEVASVGVNPSIYSNARSIKTRIETLQTNNIGTLGSSFECKIH